MTPNQYLSKTKDKRYKDLFKLLSFPSISAKSEHKPDMKNCAEWLKGELKTAGFKAKVYPTGGHPLVFAEYFVDKNLPTVLYYGHYDVQPPEPLELWKTSPFKAEVRGGYIYARGSADDKGQVWCHIKGLEAIIKTTGGLPINVKFLIEGEEETHSVNLPKWIKNNKKLLKADVIVISDTAQFDKNTPSVIFGLRGIAAAEIFVYGPDRDVHSGGFGGAIANPVNVLCKMVGQLHDKNGKIAIPGFYDDFKPITKWEKTQFRKLPFNEKEFKKSLGIPALHGESKYIPYERLWTRPTCDINGITGGYQGEGAKTIIPSFASCKITMRLVPYMKPMDVLNKLEKYLLNIAPKSVKVRVNKMGGAMAVEVPTEGPWLDAAKRAIIKGFGKEPVFTKEGGSIPIVGDFKRILGLDSLLIGFTQSDCNAHSPNERFRLVDFDRGCKTATALPFELAKVNL